jgi:hypothetical protein
MLGIDPYHVDTLTFCPDLAFIVGNMPRTMRNLLRNIFPIMMVPPGVKPEDYLQFFKADIAKLQRGYILDLGKLGIVQPTLFSSLGLHHPSQVWASGGVGALLTDMPQGQPPIMLA